MKLQTFFFSKDETGGQARLIGDELSNLFKCKCDQIPPAYQCNKEKLVVITYEKYGKLPKKFIEFIESMTTEKVFNVALIEISNTGNDGVAEVSAIFEKNGVKVVDTLGIVAKKGFFSKPKVAEEDIQKAVDFSHKIAAELFDSIK